MSDFLNFIVQNFVLICIVLILGIILTKKLKTHRKTSIYLLIILFLTLMISIIDAIKLHAANDAHNVFAVTFMASVLYFIRPLCIVCFIFLSGQKFKGVSFYILLCPLVILFVTNLFPFFPATKTLSYYFAYNETLGYIEWHPGSVQLFRFMPHIISVFYLVFLLYKSIGLFQRKHLADALSIFVCAGVVSIATIIETFFNDDGLIVILPTSIAVSTVFYYLFLYERSNKIDVLTGLFNRASYFDDISRLGKDINGIIQLDMNGLKYLNDNFGHLEGDKGLITIADAIINNASKRMYAYRLGGDEFIVLAINETKENIIKFILDFKKDIENTKYYCSIGYACKDDDCSDLNQMFKLSEERMYADKAEFYKTANIERRKSSYVAEK